MCFGFFILSQNINKWKSWFHFLYFLRWQNEKKQYLSATFCSYKQILSIFIVFVFLTCVLLSEETEEKLFDLDHSLRRYVFVI